MQKVARLAELQWLATARPEQLPPPGDWWNVLLALAGRGFGKTRMGAEWVRQKAWVNPGCRIAVVSPTAGDVRKVCVEGESGMLSVIPEALIENYNRSMGEIRLVNGSLISTVSAQEPGRLRGPQFHYAWADELAAWDYPESWDQLNFTLRLGQRPQVLVTTTPRPVPMVKDLLLRSDVCIQRGRSYDNAANLAPAALAHLEATYGGTRLGRQELEGELLEDVEGALWTRSQVEDCYLPEAPSRLKRIVVGVDPAGGGAAEIGIVVCGLGLDGKGYVLADLSMAGSPDAWGRAVVEAYKGWGADRVVVERNFGGDMAEHTIRTVDKAVPVKMVTASRGKIPRAEPVAALYEQHRVHHAGRFPKLEDQMCTYTAEDKVSPDRMDAMVWALSELMITGRSVPDVGPGGVTGPSKW